MSFPGGGQPVPPPAVATCYRHTDRTTNIACTRCGNPICPDCMNQASVGFQCPSCVREGRASTRRPIGNFGGRVSTGTPVTMTLLALNVVAFLATISGSGLVQGGTETPRFLQLAQISTTHSYVGTDGSLLHLTGVSDGAYYRIVTAMFLHFGLLHIGSNMFVLYLVGPQLERVLGWWRFLTVYLVGGIGGGVATYVFASTDSVSAGASGAIFGLFAAYVVIARKLNADLGGILSTIAINLFITFAVPNISITDHVGGLVTGGVLGLVITSAPRRPAAQIGGIVAVFVVLLIVALARTASLT